MKLGPTVLLEIMSIVQDGLLKGRDVSQRLREIDLDVDSNDSDVLTLSNEYLTLRSNPV